MTATNMCSNLGGLWHSPPPPPPPHTLQLLQPMHFLVVAFPQNGIQQTNVGLICQVILHYQVANLLLTGFLFIMAVGFMQSRESIIQDVFTHKHKIIAAAQGFWTSNAAVIFDHKVISCQAEIKLEFSLTLLRCNIL